MTVHVKQGVYHIQEQKYDGFNNTYFMQHCTSRALHADNSLPTVTAQYPKHGIPVNTRDLRQMVQLVTISEQHEQPMCMGHESLWKHLGIYN